MELHEIERIKMMRNLDGVKKDTIGNVREADGGLCAVWFPNSVKTQNWLKYALKNRAAKQLIRAYG